MLSKSHTKKRITLNERCFSFLEKVSRTGHWHKTDMTRTKKREDKAGKQERRVKKRNQLTASPEIPDRGVNNKHPPPPFWGHWKELMLILSSFNSSCIDQLSHCVTHCKVVSWKLCREGGK